MKVAGGPGPAGLWAWASPAQPSARQQAGSLTRCRLGAALRLLLGRLSSRLGLGGVLLEEAQVPAAVGGSSRRGLFLLPFCCTHTEQGADLQRAFVPPPRGGPPGFRRGPTAGAGPPPSAKLGGCIALEHSAGHLNPRNTDGAREPACNSSPGLAGGGDSSSEKAGSGDLAASSASRLAACRLSGSAGSLACTAHAAAGGRQRQSGSGATALLPS